MTWCVTRTILDCLTHLRVQAGRIPEFDVLASKLFAAAVNLKDAIVEEARQLLTTDAASTAKYYLKVMEKELAGPTSYVEKESARFVVFLQTY